jgi:deoxyadenosine/deoxycytidine kinase
MVIWINGSFGVGKTSTAEKINKEMDKSIIYDPEIIGGFLSDLFSNKENDFQDYELWRILNADILTLYGRYLKKVFTGDIVF